MPDAFQAGAGQLTDRGPHRTESAVRARLGRARQRLRALLSIPATEGIVAAAPQLPIKEIFRRFWPFARPYRRWLVLGLVFVVLGPAIDTALIWMFKVVVDQVLVPVDFGPLPWIAAAYFGLALLSAAVSVADDVLSAWIGERFLLTLRTHVFRHLHGLSLDFF